MTGRAGGRVRAWLVAAGVAAAAMGRPGGLRAQGAIAPSLRPGLSDARLWAATERHPPTAARVTSLPAAPRDLPRQDAPPGGSEVWVPLASLLLPGLGQYTQGAIGPGLGYSATAVAGLVVAGSRTAELAAMPRDPGDQLAFEGAHLAVTAGALSAWDAFHRVVPWRGGVGRYDFLGPPDDLGGLLSAPFDVRFLGRWTTLADLAFTGGVTAWILIERNAGVEHEPFRAHDAAFVTSLSLNAGVGEEALFRGWLLPLLHQKLGRRFWAANGIQAALFGLGHVPQAREYALVITASAVYSGWLTRRNEWSVREVVFQHFWYDMLVGAAELLRDEARPITLLPITIRF